MPPQRTFIDPLTAGFPLIRAFLFTRQQCLRIVMISPTQLELHQGVSSRMGRWDDQDALDAEVRHGQDD